MAEARPVDARPGLVLRVFTHPACSGCSTAVRLAWEAAERHPDVELRTVRLENEEGLAEAHSEGVKTIPTIILGTIIPGKGSAELERWVGSPEPGAVASALERLTAPA
jgi:glutaredoxin